MGVKTIRRWRLSGMLRRFPAAKRVLTFGLMAGTAAVLALTASAAPKPAKEITLEPTSGTYLVNSDVNIRSTPATRGKRLGRLKKGDRVEAVAKAGDTWLQVEIESGGLGFVFAPVLLPMIDGALKEPLNGEAVIGEERSCTYTIRFEGKSPVEDGLFDVADYEVDFRCANQGTEVNFQAFMFITEAPSNLKKNPNYQIVLDIPEITGGYEEVLSTELTYRRGDGTVVFDGISMKEFRHQPSVPLKAAASVSQALSGAVEISLDAWNEGVWKALIKLAQ
jgi:hypothetical protein